MEATSKSSVCGVIIGILVTGKPIPLLPLLPWITIPQLLRNVIASHSPQCHRLHQRHLRHSFGGTFGDEARWCPEQRGSIGGEKGYNAKDCHWNVCPSGKRDNMWHDIRHTHIRCLGWIEMIFIKFSHGMATVSDREFVCYFPFLCGIPPILPFPKKTQYISLGLCICERPWRLDCKLSFLSRWYWRSSHLFSPVKPLLWSIHTVHCTSTPSSSSLVGWPF